MIDWMIAWSAQALAWLAGYEPNQLLAAGIAIGASLMWGMTRGSVPQ